MTDLTNASESMPAFEARSGRRPAILVGLPFRLIEPLFALADCATIVAAGIAGGMLYQSAFGGYVADAGVHAAPGFAAGVAYVLAAHFLNLYRIDRLLADEHDGRRVWAAWSLAVLVLAVGLFLVKSGADVSRGSVVCFFAIGGASLMLLRWLGKRTLGAALSAGTIRGRRAMVIGTTSELARFARQELLARFGLDEIDRLALPESETNGLARSGSRLTDEALVERIRGSAAEEIVLALSWSQSHDIEMLLDQLRAVPLPVRLLPDRAVSAVLQRQATSQRSYLVEVQRSPLSTLGRLGKRLVDVVVAATSLVLLLPLLLLVAVAIKFESKGPVIFRQRRHGFNGKPFVIYKLRTMRVQEDGGTVVQATKRDPRVTRLGRVLRQTSIDELPQLLNVLQGHMSIVGPRPHALVHDHEYGAVIANYAFRHHVKPGMTGWAQVRGYRGGTPQLELMQRRVALDLWYIDNWSLSLDLYIMFKTAFELVGSRNAY